MPQKFPASDEFIRWLQSLGGMLTKIKINYGSVAEMTEHSEWDDSRTELALALVKAIHKQLRQIDMELTSHVQEKLGKDRG
jgi:hypothetical protein